MFVFRCQLWQCCLLSDLTSVDTVVNSHARSPNHQKVSQQIKSISRVFCCFFRKCSSVNLQITWYKLQGVEYSCNGDITFCSFQLIFLEPVTKVRRREVVREHGTRRHNWSRKSQTRVAKTTSRCFFWPLIIFGQCMQKQLCYTVSLYWASYHCNWTNSNMFPALHWC